MPNTQLHYNPFVSIVPDKNRQRARRAESIGLALIALVILVITLLRYWHVIHWSWR